MLRHDHGVIDYVLATCLFVGVLCFGLGMLSGRSFFDQSEELRATYRTIRERDNDRARSVSQVAGLTDDVNALTTPRHQKALRLVKSWKEVCESIPFGKRRGDMSCTVAMSQVGFPRGNLRVEILADPEKGIKKAKEFIIDRCQLVEGESPMICRELTGALPDRP